VTRTNVARATDAEKTGYRLRPPTLDDAEVIGRVHVTVWRQAYAGIIDDAFLQSLTVDEAVALWREILADPKTRPARRLVGIAPDGHIVGMIASGASRDESPATSNELHAIDVLKEHHGTGLADMMMLASVGEIGPQMLWVLADNERAQSFYRRYGFADTTTRRHHDAFKADEVLMVRAS
jgi:ribosomal protein S18 acetylase RimI-like enzyme